MEEEELPTIILAIIACNMFKVKCIFHVLEYTYDNFNFANSGNVQ
jgi:hypothetical protein